MVRSNYQTYTIFLTLIFFIAVGVLYYASSQTVSLSLDSDERLDHLRPLLMHSDHVTVALNDPLLNLSDVSESRSIQLPPTANVWNPLIQIRDQGPWGSCTAFSLRYAYLINQLKSEDAIEEPSTAFWYAKARQLYPGMPLKDTGTSLKSVVSVLNNQGFVSETMWPYSAKNIFVLPQEMPQTSDSMRALPVTNLLSKNLFTLKEALAIGNPVLIAIRVYSSFLTNTVFTTGVIPLPKKNERLLGGHAICLTGYSDYTQTFSFYNSWGTYVGLNGLFTLPYAYASSPQYSGEYYSF